MPRRKLIRPAEPLTPPEPGSLEETIYLGDCASAYAKPLAQLRWFDRRGELQMAIQRRDDAKRERERELETKNAESNPVSPVPPVPPVPTPDVETERRLAKVLKQLEEPTPEPEKAEVEPPVPPLPLPPTPSAEDLVAAEAEKQRIAKIDEDYAEVQRRYNRPLNAYERDMPRHQVKSKIAYDNQVIYAYQKEHGLLPKVGTVPHFDVEELKRENAAVQREYQQEYDYQRSGGQITPPSSLLPDYIIARRFKKGGE